MTYAQTLTWLDTVGTLGSRLGLERIRILLNRLGDPQKKLTFVHVAGTNGKGTVCACLAEVLHQAGYRTGCFTSPHLLRINERFQCGGQEISDEDFAAAADQVRAVCQKMEDQPTQFEVLTAMAFVYFAAAGCDLVLLEVGLGGRLDSTNVIDVPAVAVITKLGLDHMKELGDTLPAITMEKAGIIKPGGRVVVDGSNDSVLPLLQQVCIQRHCALTVSQPEQVSVTQISLQGITFDYGPWTGLTLPLAGTYQPENAAVVLETLQVLVEMGYRIPRETIRTGLAQVNWPGRFQVLSHSPAVILDGAHNQDGLAATVESLRTYFPDRPIRFILGILADKNVSEMLRLVAPLAQDIAIITPPSDRAMDGDTLAAQLRQICQAPVTVFPTIREAAAAVLGTAVPEDVICATGSLYAVGENWLALRAALADWEGKQ